MFGNPTIGPGGGRDGCCQLQPRRKHFGSCRPAPPDLPALFLLLLHPDIMAAPEPTVGTVESGIVNAFAALGAADGAPVVRVTPEQPRARTVTSGAASDYTPDNRNCVLCNVHVANQADPVNKNEFMAWHYKPVKGKTQGNFCWYCGRTHQSAYRARYPSLSKLVEQCGQDNDIREEVLSKQRWLLDKCIKAGTRAITISFGDSPSTVTSTERQQVECSDYDEHVELAYYIDTFKGGLGDPKTNGSLP